MFRLTPPDLKKKKKKTGTRPVGPELYYMPWLYVNIRLKLMEILNRIYNTKITVVYQPNYVCALYLNKDLLEMMLANKTH